MSEKYLLFIFVIFWQNIAFAVEYSISLYRCISSVYQFGADKWFMNTVYTLTAFFLLFLLNQSLSIPQANLSRNLELMEQKKRICKFNNVVFYLEQNLGSFPQQRIIRAEEIPQCDCPTEESASVHTEAVEGHKAILHWREGCLVWTVSSERKREREKGRESFYAEQKLKIIL